MTPVVAKFDIILDTMRRLLRRGAITNISKMVNRMHPADVARTLSHLEKRDKLTVFELIRDVKVKAEVISELETQDMVDILNELSPPDIVQILQELPFDEVADIIGELPEEKARDILVLMKKEDSEEVEDLLRYGEDTAGGIMTTEFFTLLEDTTVAEAIRKLQEEREIDMVFYIYVIDKDGKLVGVVSLRQLLLVPPETSLKQIMTTDVISVRTDTDQETVARQVARYNFLAVPVVDEEDKLVGVITVDDVVDVIRDEATEDIYRMAGLNIEERLLDSPLLSVRRRLPWLLINLATAVLAASVVGLFQGTIQKVVMLAVFMPIVAGMGGNAATQTLAVIVRGIALGELTFTNTKKVLLKEVTTGIINGAANGAVAAVIAYLWHGSPMIGLILFLAMVINLFIAGFGGTIIPLVLRWLKFDPALASSIFITTLTDVFGFLTFLGLATLLIEYLL